MRQNYQHLLRNISGFFSPLFIVLILSSVLVTMFATNVYANTHAKSMHQRLMLDAAHYVASQLEAQSTILNDENKHTSLTPLPLDNRIIIDACATAFTFSVAPEDLHNNSISVRISCTDNNWFVYGTIKQTRLIRAIVTNRLLVPNEMIGSDDISEKFIPEHQVRHDVFHNVTDIIGTKVKRRIRSGVPLASNLLCFVCEGDSVKILAHTGGLTIKTEGIAQQDGTIGETIIVKNSRSKKEITATVINIAQVAVTI